MKNGPKVKIGTDAAKLGDVSTKFENISYFEALIFCSGLVMVSVIMTGSVNQKER